MSDPELKNRDKQTYRWAGLTLTTGMYISFAAMGLGLAWWLLKGAPGGSASAAKTVPLDRIFPELLAGNPLALLNLGLVILLATPGVTLFTEIATFIIERNWRYAGIAGLVGLILLVSIAFSLGWVKLF